jgi:hypothetical protein
VDRAAGPPRLGAAGHCSATQWHSVPRCLVLSVALERRIRPSLLELGPWLPRSDSEVRAVRGIIMIMASRASGPESPDASLTRSRGAAGGEARGKPGSAAHWQLAATGI